MTNKAFIFDMDGVLIASEKEWFRSEADLFDRLFGPQVAQKIGDTMGISVKGIYQRAVSLGATISESEYRKHFDQAAKGVYSRCQITPGTDQLVKFLSKNGYQLALVSASPPEWINQVVKRLPWKDKLKVVLSVDDHPELKPKPAPDGYNYILKKLKADPQESFALEDSNPGIKSAQAAGLFTIGYRELLPANYHQVSADAIAENMNDVLKLISKL